MKELSLEEKARLYDEAIERAKLYNSDNVKQVVKDLVTYIFPELKESEDERMVKFIKQQLFKIKETITENYELDAKLTKAIDWLEKQCEKGINGNEREISNSEQKPADKVEPKFHEGDWVILTAGEWSTTLQIVNVDTNKKLYWFNDNSYLPIVDEECLHLWTIQDAKDGDVLLFEGCYNSIVLFQGIDINGKGRINYHCKCDLGNYSFGIQGDVACLGTIEEDAEHYHPATKEQRDLLFQKMKEAGYEWYADKKKLKKIELCSSQWNISDFRTWQYIVSDVLTKHDGIGQYIDDGLCKKIAKYMQEEWSKKLNIV